MDGGSLIMRVALAQYALGPEMEGNLASALELMERAGRYGAQLREGDVVFCGESMVVDPHGQVLSRSGIDEDLLLAELDFAQVDLARQKRPYLALRRPELYE
jgi:predicted amidohydrolase